MSGPEKKTGNKAQAEEVTGTAVSKLTELYKILEDPRVRRDPVVKALLAGLVKKEDDFKISSMAVATLRNAGCISRNEKGSTAQTVKENVGTPKEKKTSVKDGKPTNQKENQKSANVRSFTRSLEYLLATDVLDDSDQALMFLRTELRKDKNKVIGLTKSEEAIERKISEIGDFDLLYLQAGDQYDALMKRIGPVTEPKFEKNGFYSGPYRYWNSDTSASEFLMFATEKVSDGSEKQMFTSKWGVLAQQLKGPVLDLIIKTVKDKIVSKGAKGFSGTIEVDLYKSIVKELLKQPWSKYGKSPTIGRTVDKAQAEESSD